MYFYILEYEFKPRDVVCIADSLGHIYLPAAIHRNLEDLGHCFCKEFALHWSVGPVILFFWQLHEKSSNHFTN